MKFQETSIIKISLPTEKNVAELKPLLNSMYKSEKENTSLTIMSLRPAEFDPCAYPAHLDFAMEHYKATRFARPTVIDPEQFEPLLCPCCRRVSTTQKLPFTASFWEISSVSPAHAAYFTFLLFSASVLFFAFLFFGVNLLISMPQTRFAFVLSPPDWTLTQQKGDYNAIFASNTLIRGFLSLAAIISIVILRHFFVFFIKKFHPVLKSCALQVGIPSNTTDEKIYEDLQLLGGGQNMIITRMHDLRSVSAAWKNLLQAREKVKKLEAKLDTNSYSYRITLKKYENQLTIFEKLVGLYPVPHLLQPTPIPVVFVTFPEAQSCFVPLRVPGYSVTAAPPYNDIIWENLSSTTAQRVLSQIPGWLLAVVLVAGLLFGQWALKTLQLRLYYSSLRASWSVPLFCLGCSAIAALAIWGIAWILKALSVFEKQNMFSSRSTWLVCRMLIAGFCASAVALLLGGYLPHVWPKVIIFIEVPRWSMWIEGGTVNAITFLLLLRIVGDALLSIVQPRLLLRRLRRASIKSSLHKKELNSGWVQGEVQKAFEDPQHDLPHAYYESLLTVSICLFFAPVMPYAPALGVIDLLIRFVLQRWELFHGSACPKEINPSFTHSMASLFSFCELLLGTGCLIFDYIVASNITIFSYIVIGIAAADFVTAWLPQGSSRKLVRGMSSSAYDKTYRMLIDIAAQVWLQGRSPPSPQNFSVIPISKTPRRLQIRNVFSQPFNFTKKEEGSGPQFDEQVETSIDEPIPESDNGQGLNQNILHPALPKNWLKTHHPVPQIVRRKSTSVKKPKKKLLKRLSMRRKNFAVPQNIISVPVKPILHNQTSLEAQNLVSDFPIQSPMRQRMSTPPLAYDPLSPAEKRFR